MKADKTLKEAVASCLNVEALNRLVKIASNLLNDSDGGRKGGFFAIWNRGPCCMVVKSFGEFPEEKMSQYLRNATEKVTRLVQTREKRSFESRDEAKQQWGGGIKYGKWICAFSGFPEKLDEAISLNYAFQEEHQYASVRRRELEEIQKRDFSDNDFILPLFDLSIGSLKESV